MSNLDLELWYELYRLETRYWREVDCNAGRNAHEFYRLDGVFKIGNNCFAGRDCASNCSINGARAIATQRQPATLSTI